jgi:UDPglucose 6-dehydrogenase
MSAIGQALAVKPTWHNVVLASTVLPGACRHGLLPILERESGKQAGRDFGFCYNPQFIALGSILRDFLHPDLVLVGEFDERSGSSLAAFYSMLLDNPSAVERLSLENAELAKIALNSYVTMKITFANFLADLCERLPNGDVDSVTNALGKDRRIGKTFLRGAIGYGGPCFPRDNLALSFLAQSLGSEAEIAASVDRYNRKIPPNLCARLRPLLRANDTIAVLGLAYKPDSHVVEESQGLAIAVELASAGFEVIGYDPLAGKDVAELSLPGLTVATSLDDGLANADVVIITTPDRAFDGIRPEHLRSVGDRVLVVDCWRRLAHLGHSERVRYLAVGVGEASPDDGRLAALWAPSDPATQCD